MKLWDNHMHCHFSGDSDADPLDMIEKPDSWVCPALHLQTTWI